MKTAKTYEEKNNLMMFVGLIHAPATKCWPLPIIC